MMDDEDRGGEPAGVRLLALARAELLRQVMPALDGEARYRGKLIAKALKIAEQELAACAEAGEGEEAEIARKLAAVAAPALAASGLPPETALRDALRRGALDGNSEFYDLLVHLTERRRSLAG